MKTLIAIFLMISISTQAQNIDTVWVRNLQLQAGDWAWAVGRANDVNADSVTAYSFRRIRDRIRTVNPASFSTNVTIDSIPGKIVLAIYMMVKNAPAGEIVSRYTAMTTAIAAKTNMTTWITAYDNQMAAIYQRFRDKGKNILMDY
jgi:hypothetical protein